MIQLEINRDAIPWFAVALVVAVILVTGSFILTNNDYRVKKKQTRGPDYDVEIFKLWFPFVALIITMIGLCLLPFYLIDAPKF